MKKHRQQLTDGLTSLLIFLGALTVNFVIQHFFETPLLISGIFIFGVFLVSLSTHGYFWGVLTSLVSMLAVNFVFTLPYFQFDFRVVESVFSAVIMLIVAVMTSALTTKIKAQEHARAEAEAERMRANLLRAVSHDLRTPLTTIYGSCSAILENYDSLDKQQQLRLLGEIREDSEWLIRMVENLLSVTRIDGGKVQLSKTSTVLDELIDTVLVKFSKKYPEQKISVSVPEEFVSIPMDVMLIQQVLINLLENAVFHAEGQHEILLNVILEGSTALFEVSDDGCGIPADRLKTLFSGIPGPSDSPTDGKRHNMQIGLSVCSAIIKAHGGKIWVENNARGGASFYFTLETEAADHGQQ